MMKRLATTVSILFLVGVSSANATSITLQNATATFSQSVSNGLLEPYLISEAIDGSFNTSTNGWAIFDHSQDTCCTAAQTGVFETATDAGSALGTLWTFMLYQLYGDRPPDTHSIGDFRLSYTTDDRSTFANGLQSGGDVTANWIPLAPLTAVSSFGAILTIQGDNSILASGPNGAGTYTVTAGTSATGITGFRLETLTDPSLPTSGPGRQPVNGNFVLTEFTVDAQDGTPVPEPASLLLLGTGLAAAGMRRYRQRR